MSRSSSSGFAYKDLSYSLGTAFNNDSTTPKVKTVLSHYNRAIFIFSLLILSLPKINSTFLTLSLLRSDIFFLSSTL